MMMIIIIIVIIIIVIIIIRDIYRDEQCQLGSFGKKSGLFIFHLRTSL